MANATPPAGRPRHSDSHGGQMYTPEAMVPRPASNQWRRSADTVINDRVGYHPGNGLSGANAWPGAQKKFDRGPLVVKAAWRRVLPPVPGLAGHPGPRRRFFPATMTSCWSALTFSRYRAAGIPCRLQWLHPVVTQKSHISCLQSKNAK